MSRAKRQTVRTRHGRCGGGSGFPGRETSPRAPHLSPCFTEKLHVLTHTASTCSLRNMGMHLGAVTSMLATVGAALTSPISKYSVVKFEAGIPTQVVHHWPATSARTPAFRIMSSKSRSGNKHRDRSAARWSSCRPIGMGDPPWQTGRTTLPGCRVPAGGNHACGCLICTAATCTGPPQLVRMSMLLWSHRDPLIHVS